MIALLFRLIFAFLVFSLLMWGVRALATAIRRRQLHHSSRRPLEREKRATSRKSTAPIPPEDVIDVPYKDVS